MTTADTIATYTGNTVQTGDSFARIGANGAGLTNITLANDFSATMKTSLNAATPASVTGSVGSVTGAVGSVTGAVGSVTGSVGSVVGLTASNLDATVSSRLASASITLSGGIVSADVKKVNAVTVNGDGAGTPWGP